MKGAQPEAKPPLIIGDFYTGAYGPTIILISVRLACSPQNQG